jgi:hypothetical protein
VPLPTARLMSPARPPVAAPEAKIIEPVPPAEDVPELIVAEPLAPAVPEFDVATTIFPLLVAVPAPLLIDTEPPDDPVVASPA